jgi:Mg/Co/Ni transporter MgtE
LFESIGDLSITDKAFALQPFTGAMNSSDQAEKLVEKFQRYVAFRKINETDQLQLFHLLMRDQAANWLTSLPDNKRLDIHDLLHQFQKRYELLRVAKWKQTANLWKRKQGLD